MLYIKDEKVNIQRFISGLLVAFKDRIEFDEPRSLEEAIRKLKNFFKESKRRYENNPDSKCNAKKKGKWDKKQTRPQYKSNKENVAPHKKFNASDKG